MSVLMKLVTSCLLVLDSFRTLKSIREREVPAPTHPFFKFHEQTVMLLRVTGVVEAGQKFLLVANIFTQNFIQSRIAKKGQGDTDQLVGDGDR